MKFAKLSLAAVLVLSLPLTGCMSIEIPTSSKPEFDDAGGRFEARGDEIIDKGAPQGGKSDLLQGTETEQLTFEFESSSPVANITFTTSKGAETLENQKMPYKVTTESFKNMGAASVSPAQTNVGNANATYTCRVKKGNKVIAESVNSRIVASCTWTGADF